MDIKLLFSSGSGLQKKFNITLIILTLAIVCYTFLGFINQDINLLLLENNLNPTLLFCIFLIIPILGIKILRWRLIGSKIGLKINFHEDIKCWVSSQAFLGTPGGSGLAIRSILLKKKYNIPISESLPAIVYERLSDLISVVCLIIVINLDLLLKRIYLIPLLIVILISIIVYKLITKEKELINRIIDQLISRVNPNKSLSNTNLLLSLKKLLHPKLIILSTLLGILPWTLEGLSLYLIIKSISNYDISWASSIFAHSAAGLLGAISLLPGGLGATEASTVGLLSISSGLPIEIATASTILIRLLTIWLATIIGITSLLLPNKSSAYI